MKLLLLFLFHGWKRRAKEVKIICLKSHSWHFLEPKFESRTKVRFMLTTSLRVKHRPKASNPYSLHSFALMRLMLNEYTSLTFLSLWNIPQSSGSSTVLPELSSNNKHHYITFLFKNSPLTVTYLYFPVWEKGTEISHIPLILHKLILSYYQYHSPEWYILLPRMNLYLHPKCTVYMRIHSWHCTFYSLDKCAMIYSHHYSTIQTISISLISTMLCLFNIPLLTSLATTDNHLLSI